MLISVAPLDFSRHKRSYSLTVHYLRPHSMVFTIVIHRSEQFSISGTISLLGSGDCSNALRGVVTMFGWCVPFY